MGWKHATKKKCRCGALFTLPANTSGGLKATVEDEYCGLCLLRMSRGEPIDGPRNAIGRPVLMARALGFKQGVNQP